jgi:hypothetical protein
VTCVSNQAVVYLMKRDEFIKSVNLYKFSDSILEERFLKQNLYAKRLRETVSFMRDVADKAESSQTLSK